MAPNKSTTVDNENEALARYRRDILNYLHQAAYVIGFVDVFIGLFGVALFHFPLTAISSFLRPMWISLHVQSSIELSPEQEINQLKWELLLPALFTLLLGVTMLLAAHLESRFLMLMAFMQSIYICFGCLALLIILIIYQDFQFLGFLILVTLSQFLFYIFIIKFWVQSEQKLRVESEKHIIATSDDV